MPIDANARVLDFIDLIGEAALDSTLWLRVLEKLEQTLEAPWAYLYVHDYSSNQVEIRAASGFADARINAYEQYYAAKNPALIHGARHLTAGNVCLTQMLCPKDVFQRSELHNDWAAPQGIGDGLAATVLRTPTQVGLFGVLRRIGAPPCLEADVWLVRRLMPHLQRAVRVHTAITELRDRESANRRALDQSPRAIILLDRRGRILSMNRAVDALLRKADGLFLGQSGLETSRRQETAMLASLIREALVGSLRISADAMMVSRTVPNRALELSVLPLASSPGVLHESSAACMLLITNPDDKSEANDLLLQRLYGLTAAEAKVAVRLAQGLDPKAIAESLGHGVGTTRSHLKRVMEKTGARRQADLVRLILRGPALF
jgi:DNA-binding CsgD family transcriptional regulator